MRRRSLALVIAAASVLALGGCFDSLVGGECAEGWVPEGGRCRLAGGESDVDAGVGTADIDAGGGGDGLSSTCEPGESWCGACVDLSSDPDNCGACGRSCASGICEAGACVGALAGHVVLVGHDYRDHRPAAARVLGNAAALASRLTVRVASVGDATDDDVVVAVRRALTSGLTANGRDWTPAAMDGLADEAGTSVDVVLVLPRAAPADVSFAVGQAWQARLADFVASGGVVIALDGPGGTTADFLRGAALLDATANGTATGVAVDIAAPTDALAVGVPSPYMAERGSVTFTVDTDDATIAATSGGAALAIHLTR